VRSRWALRVPVNLQPVPGVATGRLNACTPGYFGALPLGPHNAGGSALARCASAEQRFAMQPEAAVNGGHREMQHETL